MIIKTFVSMFIEMAYYLMIGITLVGIFNIFVNRELLVKYLGSNSFASSILACLIGVPLPLCSCAVVPTGLYLKDKGASTATTTAFLISTPQTGVDSIIATYGMMGLTFAWFRPLAAFVSGVVGGWFIGLFDKNAKNIENELEKNNNEVIPQDNAECTSSYCTGNENNSNKAKRKSIKGIIKETLHYSYIHTVGEIAVHFLVGLVIAVLITVFLPTDFITKAGLNNGIIAMILMIVIGLPMYVCSTASIPIAVSFILKGISPGAAFVFLFVGPFTNAASLSILVKKLGKKITALYVSVATASAIAFGLLLDWLIANVGLSINISGMAEHSHSEVSLFKYIVAIIFALLLLYALYTRFSNYNMARKAKKMTTSKKTIFNIYGMTCSGCSSTVKGLLLRHDKVDNAVVDHEANTAVVYGELTKEELKEILSNTPYTTD